MTYIVRKGEKNENDTEENYYNDVARWRLESPALRLVAQAFIQAQIKERTSHAECASIWWRHHDLENRLYWQYTVLMMSPAAARDMHLHFTVCDYFYAIAII